VSDPQILVFDTGPLSAWACENWLGVLKAVVADRTALIPDVVVDELRVGVTRDSRIQAALDAPWILHYELKSPVEIESFATFASFLVKGDRNRGEAGVLALASAVGGTAVIDDRAARQTAENFGISVCPTLRLLCDAIRRGLLTVPLVSALADDLLIGEYHLPFQSGGFETWAKEHGLLG
jgi:predicted nucleic acid-binding protein